MLDGGPTLSDALAALDSGGGAPRAEAVRLLEQVARGLAALRELGWEPERAAAVDFVVLNGRPALYEAPAPRAARPAPPLSPLCAPDKSFAVRVL